MKRNCTPLYFDNIAFVSVIHFTTQAQNRPIKGRVLDDKG